MRKIIAIGESVLDTLYRNGQPIKAMVGGRIANATASLGMTGVPVTFCSECCTDSVGDIIVDFFNRPSRHPIFVVYALEALAVIKTLAFMLPNKPIEHRRTVKKRPAEFGILDDLRHLGVCLRRLRNPCKLFAEPRKFEPDIRIRAVSLCRQRQTFTRPGLIAMRHTTTC